MKSEKAKESSVLRLCDFQKSYILQNPNILIVEKSRQIGFTWTSGYKVIRRIMSSRIAQDHYWLSRDESLAKSFMLDVMLWIHTCNIVAKTEIVNLRDVQTTKVTFPNGCALYCLSSSYDAVIGRRGHFYLDEFAIHKDQRKLWDYCLPGTRLGFSLTVISTHRSKGTFFNELVTDARAGKIPGAVLMTVDIDTAIADGYMYIVNLRKMMADQEPLTADQFIEECKGSASSEEMYRQEYCCEPADSDSTTAVREEWMERCQVRKSEIARVAPEKNKHYYMGIDIGRHRDLTVITVMELIEEEGKPVFVMRFMKILENMEYVKQTQEFSKCIRDWKPRRCHVDATNAGGPIGEDLAKRFPSVEDIKITRVSRPKIIGNAARFLEVGGCKIFDTQDIHSDFLSIERYYNKNGDLDYYIPSRNAEVKGHGDRFMSFALALYAAVTSQKRIGRLLQNSADARRPTADENKAALGSMGSVLKAGRRRFRI